MNELYQVAILANFTATFHNLRTEKFDWSNYLFIDRDSHMDLDTMPWFGAVSRAFVHESNLWQFSYLNSGFLEMLSSNNKSNSLSFMTFISWRNKSLSQVSLNEDILNSYPVFVLLHRATEHTKSLLISGALKFYFRAFSTRTRPSWKKEHVL